MSELTKNQLTPHALAAEPGRYNLQCARVELDGVVQMDGRRLIFIAHAPGQPVPKEPYLLPRKTMRMAAAMLSNKGSKRAKIVQTDSETKVEVALTKTKQAPLPFGSRGKRGARTKEHVEIGERALRIKDADERNGAYPDWRQIMPMDDAKGSFVSFDPRYLRDALTALIGQTTAEYSSVTMFVADKDSPILVWAKDGSTALVMPLDADAGQHDLAACPIVRKKGAK